MPLASSTWTEDTQRWGSPLPADRIVHALANLASIHPRVTEEFEVGAFARFEPGQQTLLREHVVSPEGRVFFAGDLTSLCHACLQGAIESGRRAAFEVHQQST